MNFVPASCSALYGKKIHILYFLTKKLTFYLQGSKKSSTFAAAFEGKLSEWSKEPHSKCGVRITSYRGFESLTFRLKSLGASYGTLLILFREVRGPSQPPIGGFSAATLCRLLPAAIDESLTFMKKSPFSTKKSEI